jgi:polysaccharide export outer membrane protein
MLVVAMLVLAGCSGLPEAPGHVDQGKTVRYKIAPGDSLNVVVWGNSELSTQITVPPDGYITTPLVADLPAAGKTSSELARDIEQRLSKYIRDPVVTVILSNMVGEYNRQIRVVGQASNPQALQYRDGMTLLDVMIAVGGLTEYADGNNARLVREVDGKRKEYSVRLDDLLRDGDVTANVEMLPGDVLIIPETFL